jgi:hypothetical protein
MEGKVQDISKFHHAGRFTVKRLQLYVQAPICLVSTTAYSDSSQLPYGFGSSEGYP